MPASHKLKLTLLETKFQKLTASKLTNGCEAISIANLIKPYLSFIGVGSIPYHIR